MDEQPTTLDGPGSANGDEEWQVTDSFSSPPGSFSSPPIGIDRVNSSDATGGASLCRWQEDSEVSSCPMCRVTFSATQRKHHCRKCGRVVCDDCSKNRLQLQSKPTQGKVRVCNDCVANQREQQTTSFKEDTEARADIVKLLRKEVDRRYRESVVFKQVLLALDAEASDDTLLKEYYSDRETHAASFENLQARMEMRWEELKNSQTTESNRNQELHGKFQDSESNLSQARQRLEYLKQQKTSMMDDFAEFDKIQKELNDFRLKETRLGKALEVARKLVQGLEQQRQETMSQQRSRWGIGRLSRPETQRTPNSLSSNTSAHSADGNNEAFTISPGQTDSYGAGSNRRCVIM